MGKDGKNKKNVSGPGKLGIILGILLGVLVGWLINMIYAPIGLAAGVFLGAIYNDWKKGRNG